jgi:3-dehydroquinate synthase
MIEPLEVRLADRSYPIVIGRGLGETIAQKVGQLREAGQKVALITDTAVATAQAPFLERAFPEVERLAVPNGESSKSFPMLQQCCDFLASAGLDRGGVVFAVGGGVVGDLAGFAAASYLRGVAYYQVPTSLLAMVDSSVGGKTGINLEAGKNLVGAFHQPQGVFADLEVLKSLPAREFSAGMAEVIKHGLLGDAALFNRLLEGALLSPESADLDGIIHRNCAIKAAVVAADEREQSNAGGRALLNLGHTFGHAIEAVAGYGQLLHGEAVAIGLVYAGRLSERLQLLPEGSTEQITRVVEQYGLPSCLPEGLSLDALKAAAMRDKKARQGRLRYVVLESMGKAIVREDIPAEVAWGA